MVPAEVRYNSGIGNKLGSPPNGLAGLLIELLYMVIDLLEPNDILRCRSLSCSYYQKFTASALLRRLLVSSQGLYRSV